ncbi:ornithine cyclodeaminase family protein [Maribacter algarum]|uniref:Ornithine cyclodeaminase family protein n=1 Tax=Maribacter algarum (ex Zhang et al. 2020) TaxID=2578118 RepID=A0A5S3QMR9_9FLAO|nr:ornithine cyclodeaminase family protein [Maribacter algarum]TMM59194.1 ornithine cyclodeaminase family protein [Maribacter algarum]
MEPTVQVNDDFIKANTNFKELILALKSGFASEDINIPNRHHHLFPNPETGVDSTLLLMPAWHSGKEAGVKIATVSPENERFGLPSVHAIYILMNAVTGTVKATFQAKEMTAKRTAASSALASAFLSKENSTSLLMIGTGVLSTNLIRAHASVRPIDTVFVWGRNQEKAETICEALKHETFNCKAIASIDEKISEVDIISSATLSNTPLVLGKLLKEGQHIDLVGAYKQDMREADDEVIKKASVFVDSFGGRKESGDIFIPMEEGILKEKDIKGNLFSLCLKKTKGRTNDKEITLFKSVGHALEDLVAASYYYEKFTHE